MENICIVDVETTGLDASKGKVLEIAAILFNIPTRSILTQCSTLLYAEENPAYDINKIKVESLKLMHDKTNWGQLSLIMNMANYADAIVAHNASFDKNWIDKHFSDFAKNKKWICTKNDVSWPIRKGAPLSLINICSELGVPIINAHRALSDCQLLVSALGCIDDLDFFLDQSGIGKVTYYANVGYEKRQIVKDAGFQWNNELKLWCAKLTEQEAKSLPFPVCTK